MTDEKTRMIPHLPLPVVEHVGKIFTLRINLTGPVGCARTHLQRKHALLIDPWPGWVIELGNGEYTVHHARQNLNTGELNLYFGAIWTEPEFYDAKLQDLLADGWMVCDE